MKNHFYFFNGLERQWPKIFIRNNVCVDWHDADTGCRLYNSSVPQQAHQIQLENHMFIHHCEHRSYRILTWEHTRVTDLDKSWNYFCGTTHNNGANIHTALMESVKKIRDQICWNSYRAEQSKSVSWRHQQKIHLLPLHLRNWHPHNQYNRWNNVPALSSLWRRILRWGASLARRIHHGWTHCTFLRCHNWCSYVNHNATNLHDNPITFLKLEA